MRRELLRAAGYAVGGYGEVTIISNGVYPS